MTMDWAQVMQIATFSITMNSCQKFQRRGYSVKRSYSIQGGFCLMNVKAKL